MFDGYDNIFCKFDIFVGEHLSQRNQKRLVKYSL